MKAVMMIDITFWAGIRYDQIERLDKIATRYPERDGTRTTWQYEGTSGQFVDAWGESVLVYHARSEDSRDVCFVDSQNSFSVR